jgi:hypothetical protein
MAFLCATHMALFRVGRGGAAGVCKGEAPTSISSLINPGARVGETLDTSYRMQLSSLDGQLLWKHSVATTARILYLRSATTSCT